MRGSVPDLEGARRATKAPICCYQAEITYLQAVTLRLQDTTALFLALGSGWETGAVPVPDCA
ncbi:hypothetical protein BKK81_33970 (plasmid) [Cupriavidus sp. USMAHM13]|uniref:hypothetical protein n=1 Tax=Cupriavidus sp. USMAHM13 TaxID=1389192 RepID=UPI0008A6FBA4|nr:hypothetical protein [Cupriavidus sp. USMAHM13]AOZ04372.1 hypothetical protein BKK81_33970 [Cupriavidus sp. USMAHM13]